MNSAPGLAFEVRPYDSSGAEEVARLHGQALPDAFLTTLGTRFLSRLYEALDAAPHATILVAVDDQGRTLGFVAGAHDVQAAYRHVLIHAGLRLAAATAGSLRQLGTWRRIAETVLYPLRAGSGRSHRPASVPRTRAELLSIAVETTAHRRGIARALVQELEASFRGAGLGNRYRVVTDATDPRSNAFYLGLGFRAAGEFEHHGRRMNLYEKHLT